MCADAEQLAPGEVDAIARHLRGEQVAQLEDAARRVGAGCAAAAPLVVLGAGAFLGRAVGDRIGRAVLGAPAAWGAGDAEAGPAAALAWLLAVRAGAAC